MIFLKNIKKGFILIETLIVITLVGISLFYIYIQFNLVFDQYQKSFQYNTVEGLYRANEIKQFLLQTNFSELIDPLNDGELYVEFSNCLFSDTTLFCEKLFSDLKIEKIFLLNEDITAFNNYVKNSNLFSDKIMIFIDYIKYERDYGGYRILIEFTDNQICSINFL